MLTKPMRVFEVEKESQLSKMRPGTVILSVHLEFSPVVERFREIRSLHGRPEPSLQAVRTSAAVRIRKGLLPINRIVDGRAIVTCGVDLYKELVTDVLKYQERHRQED